MVIGYFPPYAHAVHQKMRSLGAQYGYFDLLENAIRPLFENSGYGFYNFSDGAVLGGSDDEMLDGMHGSEKTSIRLVMALLEKEPTLRSYLDADYLKNKLSASNSPHLIFGDQLT